MKYLPVSVYRDGSGYDCSMNGVTARFDRLYVPVKDGFLTREAIEAKGEGNRILAAKEPAFSDCPPRLYPETISPSRTMFGGNFVYTSDSRFRRAYGWAPVAVHDRVE